MVQPQKPLKWPELGNIGRDPHRLQMVVEVRLDNRDLLVIDAEWKRVKMLWLIWGKINPEFGKWLKDALYRNPNLFEELDLPSSDTILKDNREIERHGFFSRPKPPQEPTEPDKDASLDHFS